MKPIAVIAALTLSAGAAYADPVTIEAPAAPISPEAAQAYVNKLEKAVKDVCFAEAGPAVGIGYFTYRDCIKATRASVAKQDPTGLYSRRESTDAMVVAAK